MPGGQQGLESFTGGQIVFEKPLAAFLQTSNKQLGVVLSAPQASPLDLGLAKTPTKDRLPTACSQTAFSQIFELGAQAPGRRHRM